MEQPALGIQGLIHALRRTQIRESMASSIHQHTPPCGVKGFELSLGTMLSGKCSPTLPSPPLGGHAPSVHFPKQNFQVTESQGSKLQTGRAGQAICCLNHYLHRTSKPRASPWSDSEKAAKIFPSTACPFQWKISLAFWPKKWKRRRGRVSGVPRALWNQAHGTESQGLSNALRGQNRAGARQDIRLTHQWHLRFQGACATVSYPEWCVQDPLLPSLAMGQGHPPWHATASPCSHSPIPGHLLSAPQTNYSSSILLGVSKQGLLLLRRPWGGGLWLRPGQWALSWFLETSL